MSHVPTRDPDLVAQEGKPAAAVVWLLYILSIPSAGVLVLVGLLVAYFARGSAQGWVRSHFDAQVRLFWLAFWWNVIPWIVVGLLTLVLVGVLFWWAPFVINFVVMVWFTVKSVLGLLDLLRERATR